MSKTTINSSHQSAASPSQFAQELVKTLCLFSLNCGCESCANEVIQCAECVECQISMREIANDQFVKARSGAAQEVSPRQKAMQAAKEIESDCIEQSDEGYAFEVSRAAAIIEKLLGGDTRELKAALSECVKQMKDAASLLEMFPDDYGDAINRAEKLLG